MFVSLYIFVRDNSTLTIGNKVLSLKGAYRTGYAVLGASAITTVALVLL
jgi:hypothetical protein